MVASVLCVFMFIALARIWDQCYLGLLFRCHLKSKTLVWKTDEQVYFNIIFCLLTHTPLFMFQRKGPGSQVYHSNGEKQNDNHKLKGKWWPCPAVVLRAPHLPSGKVVQMIEAPDPSVPWVDCPDPVQLAVSACSLLRLSPEAEALVWSRCLSWLSFIWPESQTQAVSLLCEFLW